MVNTAMASPPLCVSEDVDNQLDDTLLFTVLWRIAGHVPLLMCLNLFVHLPGDLNDGTIDKIRMITVKKSFPF